MTYEFRFVPWHIGHEDHFDREARFASLGAQGWQIVAVIGEWIIMQRVVTP